MTAAGPVRAVLVTTSVDSEAAALGIAEAVVSEGLAACVHIGQPVTSIYRWEGRLERNQEWTCQMKTTPSGLDALLTRVRALHPYDVPEILAVDVRTGDAAYLDWVEQGVRAD